MTDDAYMVKLRLLLNLLVTISVLLSQWLIPLLAIAMAATVVHTLWIKIALRVGRSIVALCLPSVENLSDERFPDFIATVKLAITKLLSIIHIRYRKVY